jgi:ABC transport system ATP-binding/permease protein
VTGEHSILGDIRRPQVLRVMSGDTVIELRPESAPVFIGRDPSCGIAVPELIVSSRHLRVLWDTTGWLVEDRGSVNGTFIDELAVSQVHVEAALEVRLGDPISGPIVRFEPMETLAVPYLPMPIAITPVPEIPDWLSTVPATSALARPVLPFEPPPLSPTFAVVTANAEPDDAVVFGTYELTVETSGVRRLDRLSLTLRRGTMLGVLGGSGAGKSTLLKAITGSDPATSGTVQFEGRDLYRDFAHLRQRVGYVPQDDILHASLTVRSTLEFGSMLRMPTAGVTDRATRVGVVVEELGLAHRIDAKVTELSGGQRKRLNVALELQSRPALLILDEPTSGLDPANERSLMQLLRQLADGGRTVIVVTHSTESLHLCDDVLFLARGGTPAYLGPPADLASELGTNSLVDAFAFVDNHPDPAELRALFDARQPLLVPPTPLPSPPTPAPIPWQQRWAGESDHIGHDFWILLRRAVAILRGDRRNAIILAAQGPVIAFLMLVVFGAGKLDQSKGVSTGASSVLLALVLSVVFVGAAGSVREIVKERPILLREQAVGVSTAAYVAAKVTLQGTLVLVQAVVIVVFTLIRQGGPDKGLFLFGSATEILAAVFLAGLGAVALGLLISAVVTSADKAMTLLPVALFLQLLLAGVIVPVSTIGIQQLSWLVGSQWGLDAVGSVDDLWTLRGCSAPAFPGLTRPNCSTLWQHAGSKYVLAMIMLSALFMAATYLTFRILRRHDPVVVLAASAASA